jgi:multisubunit Na+/H+ antiporter MnhE subunit
MMGLLSLLGLWIIVANHYSPNGIIMGLLYTIHTLVGGFNPSEKYLLVSWGYYSQYIKPPTS